MDPRPPTDQEAQWWADRNGSTTVQITTLGGPEEGDGIIPCPAILDHEHRTIHVAYQLEPVEIEALVQGGTLWLTTWETIPIHRQEVTYPNQDPEDT